MRNTGRKKIVLVAALLVALFITQFASASIVPVRRFRVELPSYSWYSGPDQQLAFDNQTFGGNSKLYVYDGDSVEDFEITGKVDFTPAMINDVSSSGDAAAYFDGNATFKFYGGLKDINTGSYVYGGANGSGNEKQIFEATIKPYYEDNSAPTSERWLFEEDSEAILEGKFDRTIELEIVAGSEGLPSGITLGSDTYKIFGPVDLAMSFMTSIGGSVNNFSSTIPGGPTVEFNAVAPTPEPATLALLTIGAFIIRRKK